MTWAAIAGAIGGAVKKTLKNAPETPKNAKKLFLEQEQSKRKREDAEWEAEQKRAALLQQADDDRSDAEKKLQSVFDSGLLDRDYNPAIPQGVSELLEFEQRQNEEAGAVGSIKRGGHYRMGSPMKNFGGNLA